MGCSVKGTTGAWSLETCMKCYRKIQQKSWWQIWKGRESLCKYFNLKMKNPSGMNLSRTSSVSGTLECREGGRGFNSQGWSKTQGLKITEK